MKKLLFLFLILILAASDMWSQEGVEKLIHGKVIADMTSVEGINVLNLVSAKTAVTNKNGEFSILVKDEDLLVMTAVNLEIKRKLIEEEDLKSDLIVIRMIPKIMELEEVTVNENSNINAESLGIVPKGQKTYTPAERKLKTAGDFKPIHLFGLLGGALAVDPIINAINGKTKRLKKEIEIERKEHLLLSLESMFDEDYYTEKFEIPKHFVKGFQYYLVEDKSFASALKSKNRTKIILLMGELAIKYNQIITNEEH